MDYYKEIKQELIKNEVTKSVKNYSINQSDLNTYYNVGKLLSEAGKHYGDGIVKNYALRLTKELGKGYTETNLKYYRKFYLYLKSHTLCDKLSWSHYRTILYLKNDYEIEYYINICVTNNLSVRQLRERIKSNEYERLPENTKNKIITNNDLSITDLIKEPIVIKSNNDYEYVTEEVLQKMILENIPSFLKEIGDGYSFIQNEYPIRIGNKYNYIDILLFNYKYNCFVVVELKVTKLRKEHVGQIEVYMNYIDKNLKSAYHDKTIGLIVCKENDKYIIEYSTDKRIIAREYILI